MYTWYHMHIRHFIHIILFSSYNIMKIFKQAVHVQDIESHKNQLKITR